MSAAHAGEPSFIQGLLAAGDPPLIDVLERIAATPRRVIVVDRPLVPVGELRALEPEALDEALADGAGIEVAAAPPVHAVVRGVDLRFQSLRDARPRSTTDTPANRFVARFVARALAAGPTREHAARLDRVARALGAAPSGRVASTDPVLRHDPLYRRVVTASAALDRARSA